MARHVQVEAARIPDRDRLLRTLQELGIEARAVDEVGIEVPSGQRDDLYRHVEALILELGEPFVPVKKDGTIYLRPPGD
jgi:hypothetical protein